MPDYDDENHPLTSSKKFSSVRFRGSGISRSELKASISGPHTFVGGVVSTTALGNAPLRTLNGTRPLHPNSVSPVLNGSPPSQQMAVGRVRRNSDIPLRRHHSSFAWPSNYHAITPVHGSHHPPRTTHKKPHKAAISKPLVLDPPRFSSAPGMSRKTSRRSTQLNRASRRSGTMASGILKGNLEVTLQESPLSDQQARGSNLLNVPSDDFDPRTMMESFPALNLDLTTNAASFGSVKQRTMKIDKALRTSRAMLLPPPREKVKPDLVYTDDSDGFSSPPSTPSTPVWEATVAASMPKTDPKLDTKLELADVHAQIQAMIDSANRPLSREIRDYYLTQDQEPSNTQRNNIPPSLRPSNTMCRSFPRLATIHKRSVSSPPLGSDIYHVYPPDFRVGLYRPVLSVIPHKPVTPVSPPAKITPTSPALTTPTKGPSSERSDSPSVYSQASPSSRGGDVTPTASNTSSPDHPYAKSKHDRLLAAISEGISSPTKSGPSAPSILGSGHRGTGKINVTNPPLNTETPVVPMIVVTDPDDDDLVYSESSFSIVDMYTGSVESLEPGIRRRRTRTANPVSRVSIEVPNVY